MPSRTGRLDGIFYWSWTTSGSSIGREGDLRLDVRVDLQDGPPAWLMMKIYREFRRFEPDSPALIEGLMLELLGETSRTVAGPVEAHAPRWLRA